MRRRRVVSTSRLPVLITGVCAVSTLLGASAAQAHIPCQPAGTTGLQNRFAGVITPQPFDSFGNTYLGTSAIITVRSGPLCDVRADGTGFPTGAVDNFNTGWSMLYSPRRSDGTAQDLHAQVGYFRYYNQRTYHFTEFTVPNQSGLARYLYPVAGPNLGASHRYFVQYSPSRGCLEMNADLTSTSCTSYDPVNPVGGAAAWQRPFSNAWTGESLWYGSDVPGTPTATARYSDMLVYDSSYTWRTQIPNLVTAQPTFERTGPVQPANRAFDSFTAF